MKQLNMETQRKSSRCILTGSGVVHTTRRPLVDPDCLAQDTYRRLVILANKHNTGTLYVDTGNQTQRISLRCGEQAQLDVPSVRGVHVLGDAEDTGYDWTAM
jgi:hypothetical protein